MRVLEVFIFMLIAFLIGSIPTGYWLTKCLKGIDIRQFGSGSTGATNVYRTVGPIAGISVFVIDFLKGYLPTAWAASSNALVMHANGPCWPEPILPHHLFPVLMAAATLIGHSRSIFLGFKGGKSAATGLGTLFALSFKVGFCTFCTWVIILYLGKMVSLASILATASCILYMFYVNGPPAYIAYCILGFFYVTYRHKENIKRIMAGTEPKIGSRK